MPGTDQDTGIGRRIRAARQRRGWTREALAFHANISWSAVAQLETGRRRNLRPGTVSALAGALGVTADYLVSGAAFTPSMLEHGALLYGDDETFLAASAGFLAEAAARSEAALAVTSPAHAGWLRDTLGDGADHVEFADPSNWRPDLTALDRYRSFLATAISPDTPWARILVDPAWSPGNGTEAQQWVRYESILNLTFSTAPLTLLCAYDARRLDEDVLAGVRHSHPHTIGDSPVTSSPHYVDPCALVLESPDLQQ